MSRPKTDINPIRANRVKTIIDREDMSQSDFAARVPLTQQAISRIVNMKTALTEETAAAIIRAYPRYRLEWLLGYDDYMSESDQFDDFVSRINEEHDNNVFAVRHLAKLRHIDLDLYASGHLHANGVVEDDYIARIGDRQVSLTYSDLTDLIDDLAALTESRLKRIAAKANQ